MTIHPLTKRSPLDIASTRVEVSNTFPAETFVALTASGWALADNTDAAKRAVGWLVASDPGQFWFVVAREVVEWSGHGFALDAELWLGTSGQVVTTKPTGVEVVQKVGKVLDADHVQLFPEGGADESDYLLLSGRSGGQTILQGLTLEGGVVVNDLGEDVDFRVESDTEPNALFVDGATGWVGIGTQNPTQLLHLRNTETNGAANLHFQNDAQVWRIGVLGADGDAFIFRNNSAGTTVFKIRPGSPANSFVLEPSGLALLGSGSFGGGVGVLFLANRTTAPGSDPVGGALLYAESGDLKKRTSGGTDSKLLSETEGDARYQPKFPTDGSVKMPFYMSSPPDLWDRETDSDLNDAAVRIVTTGGGTVPSPTLQDADDNITTEATVLTAGNLPSGTYILSGLASGGGSTFDTSPNPTQKQNTLTGSGSGHAHGIQIKFAEFLVARFTGV